MLGEGARTLGDRMKLLQRYILIELLKVFALLLSVLTVMLVFVGVFREAQQSGLGAVQIVQILPYIIPSLLPYTIPATLLLAVCVVYGRLSGDLEIVAAKSAGINPLSLLLPAFGLGVVLAAGSFVLSDRIIPWAVTQMQQKISDALEDIFLDRLRVQHHISDPAQGYSISVMEVRGKTLILPTFQYLPRGGSPSTLQAEEARIEFNLEKQVVILNLLNCQIDAPNKTSLYVARESIEFPLPDEVSRAKPRHMSLASLRTSMQQSRADIEEMSARRDIEAAFALTTGRFESLAEPRIVSVPGKQRHERYQYHKMRTEVHSRYSLSTSCLFFVILGAPYSISQGKKQFLTTFFLCFMPILLLYYPVMLLMMNLSKSGGIDSAWAMWVPNAILFVVGWGVLKRVLQH